MRALVILVLLLCTPVYAGNNGFFMGGAAESMDNARSRQFIPLDEQLERSRQRRLMEESNDILRQQRDRQWQQDIDNIFGTRRR